MYDVDGCLIRKIKLLRINDLALTRDGTVMVMVTQEKLIKVQRLVFDGKDVRYHPSCGNAALVFMGLPTVLGRPFCICDKNFAQVAPLIRAILKEGDLFLYARPGLSKGVCA